MEKRLRTLGSLHATTFSAHLDEVTLTNGEIKKRIRIDHPEASAVVPLLPDRGIVMVRQYRYAMGLSTLEIPAGKVDPGEDPEACGRRELFEETGFEARVLQPLYTYTPAIGYSNERIHIFLAPGVERRSGRGDENEISAVEIIPLTELKEMVREGQIQDGKTLIGLVMAGLFP